MCVSISYCDEDETQEENVIRSLCVCVCVCVSVCLSACVFKVKAAC